MSRIFVSVRPVPAILDGIPLPKSSKGRPFKPHNPVFAAMQPGQCVVVSGEDECKAMRSDLSRWTKHVKDTGAKGRYTTRNLAGHVSAPGLEPFPEHTMGLWCIEAYEAHDTVEQTEVPVSSSAA